MSWQQAKAVAAALFQEAKFPEDLSGKIVLLPDFESEQECRFFVPERGLSFHKMVLKSAGRAARIAGGRVTMQIVSSKRYRAWLEKDGLLDTPEHRREYLLRQARALDE